MFAISVWNIGQFVPSVVIRLINTQSGALLNPCPTVALEPVPVYFTILNPASVLADTELVILPFELLDAEPPAFQAQPT